MDIFTDLTSYRKLSANVCPLILIGVFCLAKWNFLTGKGKVVMKIVKIVDDIEDK